MRKLIGVIVVILTVGLLLGCGPKPYYKTSAGKKKIEHYNKVPYGQKLAH